MAVTKCFFCGEDSSLLMGKRMVPNENGPIHRAAHNKVYDMTPCSKCEEFMKQGIILIGIDTEKSEVGWNENKNGEDHWMPNPYRSGNFSVIREEGFRRVFDDEIASGDAAVTFALKHRWMFINHEFGKHVGLFPEKDIE